MLTIEVLEGGTPPRTLSFSRHTLGLGRSLPSLSIGSDISLAANGVLPRHVELFEQEGLLWALSLGPLRVIGDETSTSTMYGRERRRDEKDGRALAVGNTIELIGSSVSISIVHFMPVAPRDYEEREGDFLRAIEATPSSVADRLVYADFLEEAGWLIRADYLRLQLRLLLDEALEGDLEARDRYLKNLAPARSWVDQVGAPTISATCPIKLGRSCPVRWSAAPTRPSVCQKCAHAVCSPSI